MKIINEKISGDYHILFGVEADLLNENGDIYDKIQNISTEFMILDFGNDEIVIENY